MVGCLKRMQKYNFVPKVERNNSLKFLESTKNQLLLSNNHVYKAALNIKFHLPRQLREESGLDGAAV